jgi:nucleotide-binding universal stress UspA family protein
MKHILVHLDASPRAALRLAIAQQLATQHEAQLTALYGVLPELAALPWGGSEWMATVAAQVVARNDERRARTQAMVADAAARPRTVAPQWVDGAEQPYWQLLQRAPYADLLVLGQADETDVSTGTLPPGLVPGALCDAGRPTLLVPYAGTFDALPRRVLIAWHASREAARALHASLPWLCQASRIDVAIPIGEPGPSIDHSAELGAWLRARGVQAPVSLHHLSATEPGEALVSLAADQSSDLLVMGCYGHSRAREWVLGGATSSVLRTMTLPVLMSH